MKTKTFISRITCTTTLPTLLLLFTPASLIAAQWGDFSYTNDAVGVTITDYTGPGGEVVIPNEINGLPVTRIGDYAFYGCYNLTAAIMPNSLVSIGDNAFFYCSRLTNATIPNSVTNIGESVFGGCASLSAIFVNEPSSSYNSVDGVLFDRSTNRLIQFPEGKSGSYTIPNSVTIIGDWAFYRCRSLTAVTMPDGLASIGKYAFCECTTLTSVTIPDSVTHLDDLAFALCYSLTNITIPDNVTRVGRYAFSECWALTSVGVGSAVTNIGEFVFSSCTSLREIVVDALNSSYSSVDGVLFNKDQTTLIQCPAAKTGGYVIPTSVTRIGSHGFDLCTSLTNIIIPNSVTNIGSYAFGFCRNLTTIMIPESVMVLDGSAFGACTSLRAISVDERNPSYSSADGVLFNKAQTVLVKCPAGWVGSYTIPNSVTWIWGFAFESCTNLASVTIPNSVTKIGMYAFGSCIKLTSLIIPNNVTTMDGGIFHYCTNLTSLTIPEGVSSIGDRMFSWCTSLTNVTLGSRVRSIGYGAFEYCANLTSLTIPERVSSIGDRAFSWCTRLTNVTLGSSVCSIGYGAFEYCANLTGVYFQGNAPSLGQNAFYQANRATVYYLPGTGGWGPTFGGRPTALWLLEPPLQNQFNYVATNGGIMITRYSGPGGAVTVPDTMAGLPVRSIGPWAFYSCTNLTSVTIPDTVTGIGDCAFADCWLLESITVPDTVVSIGSQAFYNNVSLASVVLGNCLASIGEYAFSDCRSLTSVTIPASVTGIADTAFQYCTGLTAFYFKGNAVQPGSASTRVLSDAIGAVVYSLPGTTGWGPTYRHLPTLLWNPTVQTSHASFGVRTNHFGFTVAGTPGIPVVVEACTNLTIPAWFPLSTNTLINGSTYFSDRQWTNHPVRFYRLRSP